MPFVHTTIPPSLYGKDINLIPRKSQPKASLYTQDSRYHLKSNHEIKTLSSKRNQELTSNLICICLCMWIWVWIWTRHGEPNLILMLKSTFRAFENGSEIWYSQGEVAWTSLQSPAWSTSQISCSRSRTCLTRLKIRDLGLLKKGLSLQFWPRDWRELYPDLDIWIRIQIYTCIQRSIAPQVWILIWIATQA